MAEIQWYSTRGGRVDGFGEALESDVSFFEVGDEFDEMFQGTRKTVKPPDNERIASAKDFESFF